MNRRELLAIACGGVAASLSGCAALVDVQDSECRSGLVGGSCQVLVKNNGLPGEYSVVVKYQNRGRTIGEDRTTVHLGMQEERIVEVAVDPPSNTNRYTVDVGSE